MSNEYIFNYLACPSKAVLLYRDQFIFLNTRSGGLVEPSLSMINEIIDDIEKLQRAIPKIEYGIQNSILALRHIWFDDKNGCISIYVEQLFNHSSAPYYTIEQIKEALHDVFGWYNGKGINVESWNTKVLMSSDYFHVISDEFYKRFEEMR